MTPSRTTILGIASFLPERVVENPRANEVPRGASQFFQGVAQRRFASPDYSSAELGARALERALSTSGVDAGQVDLIIASAMIPDVMALGIGTAVQHRVGAAKSAVINVDTNCTSFLTGLTIADAFIRAGTYETIAIVTATNFVSRMADDYRQSPTAWPLGDGAAAAILGAGESAILASRERAFGERYGVLALRPDPVDGARREYFQSGRGDVRVDFNPSMLERLMTDALHSVPKTILECLETARVRASDLALLVTHQPNRLFIDEWRRRVGVPPERCHDTLAQYGNMFQSSIPVTLADAVELGKVRRGDLVALGGFANAGDSVSAVVLRW